MKPKNKHLPRSIMVSRQINLWDFGFEKPAIKILKEIKKDINQIELIKFIECAYNYAKVVLNKYSNDYSKHEFTQPALFTLLAIKFYTQSTYRQITDLLTLSDRIKEYLHLKRVPHFTTLHKFFQRLPTSVLKEINKLILIESEIEPEIIALDGTGFTSDYADKYYAKIRKKERKGLH